jgi:hypothetical protein
MEFTGNAPVGLMTPGECRPLEAGSPEAVQKSKAPAEMICRGFFLGGAAQ